MNELDTYVQSTMKSLDNPDRPHVDRAVEAVVAIESQVRAEFSLRPDTPLPIPVDWEHRIPAVSLSGDIETVKTICGQTVIAMAADTGIVERYLTADDFKKPAEEHPDFWGEDSIPKPGFWARFTSRLKEQ